MLPSGEAKKAKNKATPPTPLRISTTSFFPPPPPPGGRLYIDRRDVDNLKLATCCPRIDLGPMGVDPNIETGGLDRFGRIDVDSIVKACPSSGEGMSKRP